MTGSQCDGETIDRLTGSVRGEKRRERNESGAGKLHLFVESYKTSSKALRLALQLSLTTENKRELLKLTFVYNGIVFSHPLLLNNSLLLVN